MKNNVFKVAMLGILSALSIVLMLFVRFPIIPAVPFMEYEPADIVILIGSFLYGPIEGLVITLIVCIVQGTTVSASSGWVGIVMHIISSGTLAIVAGSIYKRIHNRSGALLALVAGSLAMVLVMIPANLFFTVKFWGFPRRQVIDLLLPGIIPFNLIKAGINSVVIFLVYKPISKVFYMAQQRSTR